MRDFSVFRDNVNGDVATHARGSTQPVHFGTPGFDNSAVPGVRMDGGTIPLNHLPLQTMGTAAPAQTSNDSGARHVDTRPFASPVPVAPGNAILDNHTLAGGVAGVDVGLSDIPLVTHGDTHPFGMEAFNAHPYFGVNTPNGPSSTGMLFIDNTMSKSPSF